MEVRIMGKLIRRMFCMALCAALLLGTVAPGLAATFEVSNADEMSQSWSKANEILEKDNTFVMTNNIDMTGHGLDAMDNRTYTIESKGDANYTLTNVYIYEGEGTFSGTDPQVNINADIVSNKNSDTALTVMGDVQVAVSGDVTNNYDGDWKYGVSAMNGADVMITGDVTAKDNGVQAIDATVTVLGDVKVTGSKVVENSPDFAVSSDDGGLITVYGDVTSTKGGANVTDKSGVHIYGDLSAKAEGLHVVNQSNFWVEGDAYIPGDAWAHELSGITVDGDMTVGGTLQAEKSSKIAVLGELDVEGGFVGVSGTSSLVVMGGDMTVEGDMSGYEGSSVVVSRGSTLVVDDGGLITNDLQVLDKSEASADSLAADTVAVGNYSQSDKSQLVIYGDTTGLDTTVDIYAAGKSYSQYRGNVKGSLMAEDNAKVEIWGRLDHVPQVFDNAVVHTNMHYKTKTYYENAESYAEDNIINLCKGYTTNSSMMDHMDTLRDVMTNVSVALTEKMNLGTAFVISLFQGEDIAMDLIPSFDYDVLLKGGYDAGSIRELKNAKKVNSYMVEMYKSAIAQSLKSAAESEYSELATEQNKNAVKWLGGVYNYMSGSASTLSEAERKFFDKAMANDILSYDEAREYLITFGGYKAGQHGLGPAIDELVNFSKAAKAIGTAAKAGKVVLTAAEFVDFFQQNYSNQVKVLDNMLLNQTMDPEMFVAVAQLRAEYDVKFTGFVGKLRELGEDIVVDKIKDGIGKAVPLFTLVDGVMDVAEALGAINKQDAVHKAAPIICYLPDAMEAYEEAILRVKNGDTSAEALELVNMNYTFVKESLVALCDYMTVAGNAKQKAEFQELADQLEDLKLGHCLNEVDPTLEAMAYEKFYEQRIDPNGGKKYFA